MCCRAASGGLAARMVVAEEGPHPSEYRGVGAARPSLRPCSPAIPGNVSSASAPLTAKLTANLIDARWNRGTATDAGSSVELHGRTATDSQESAGQS